MSTQTERKAGWQLFLRRFPHARLLWSVENNARAGVDVGGALRAYSLNGRIVIIHDYVHDNGWTAYVDPFTTLGIDETFDAIAKHVGA
jgi:hypothetical protein